MPFRDRADAGRRLAQHLRWRLLDSPVVLGLARGGVPVAAEVATGINAPLEIFVARKVGLPGNEELGIGAIAEGLEEPVLSETARDLGIGSAELRRLADRSRVELARQVALYRGGRPLPDLAGREVILVDDGLATGVTAEAALRGVAAFRPKRLILAEPVCAPEALDRLGHVADEVVCVEVPSRLFAVGQWYRDFSQSTDEEVLDLLARARAEVAAQRR
ncbi:MAG TPA: phosphoribosyltransferase family protein [Acidimicrobiales bacterium]|jgi:putative phosphoribosyl transferase